MILDILRWYLVLTGIGVIGFPIVFTFLKKLPGRGFVFARPMGLLLISFLYWLLGSLGFLRNETGSLLIVVCLTAALSAAFCYKNRAEIREWLGNAKRFCIVSELVFLLGFVLDRMCHYIVAWIGRF